jgi:hypothetical protein
MAVSRPVACGGSGLRAAQCAVPGSRTHQLGALCRLVRRQDVLCLLVHLAALCAPRAQRERSGASGRRGEGADRRSTGSGRARRRRSNSSSRSSTMDGGVAGEGRVSRSSAGGRARLPAHGTWRGGTQPGQPPHAPSWAVRMSARRASAWRASACRSRPRSRTACSRSGAAREGHEEQRGRRARARKGLRACGGPRLPPCLTVQHPPGVAPRVAAEGLRAAAAVAAGTRRASVVHGCALVRVAEASATRGVRSARSGAPGRRGSSGPPVTACGSFARP